ncbi:hypothetical protein KP509_12G075200 [Ceratopteris richardii]|uniref:Protein kinase domain-containing protein n=1 Tax=Ceratopteris richardii TaxID=49495 RepID=A0A8T2TQW8_CERRI|nr:hypothetical protein KP509_12G075200 [Ceratopteris richardii]
MHRYKAIKFLGDGTYGSVWKALNIDDNEFVAVKKIKQKYYTWEECMNLREVKPLQKLKHPHIVRLKEVVRENNELFFVFECMEFNLYQAMKDLNVPITESRIRSWCFQIFQALDNMHSNGYFHRDMKPENLLVTGDLVKVADFGFVREVHSEPPYTDYVSTRWYRAPEVLLRSRSYGPAIDMWAMGAIMAELFSLQPLFPGESEVDEIYKICNVIGSPSHHIWAEGMELAAAMNFRFPKFPQADLSCLLPTASSDAIDLILALCSWSPERRPSASEALQHPLFKRQYQSLRVLSPQSAPHVKTCLTQVEQMCTWKNVRDMNQDHVQDSSQELSTELSIGCGATEKQWRPLESGMKNLKVCRGIKGTVGAHKGTCPAQAQHSMNPLVVSSLISPMSVLKHH